MPTAIIRETEESDGLSSVIICLAASRSRIPGRTARKKLGFSGVYPGEPEEIKPAAKAALGRSSFVRSGTGKSRLEH